jgi:hypothetical protein
VCGIWVIILSDTAWWRAPPSLTKSNDEPQFFARAGFQRVEAVSRDILLLHPKNDQMASIVTLWQEGHPELAEQLLGLILKQREKRAGEVKLYAVYKDRGPSSALMHSWRGQLACEIIPLLSTILEKALSTNDCQRV